MGLAQDGEVDAALALAERALRGRRGDAPPTRRRSGTPSRSPGTSRATTRRRTSPATGTVSLAAEADNPGWASNGLSMRAMALARQGRIEPALLDLARAEVELAACDDDGLRCWAHTGLGYAYLELRLYELAQPHMVAAQELDASPIPLAQAPVIDLMNLAELHLRWADELERVFPHDAVRRARSPTHRADGPRATPSGRSPSPLAAGNPQFVATCRAMELLAPAAVRRRASLDELREAFAASRTTPTTRAAARSSAARWPGAVGARRARRGRRRSPARRRRLRRRASDWQVTASAQWLLVEMEAQSGVPGRRGRPGLRRACSPGCCGSSGSAPCRARRPRCRSSGCTATTSIAQRAAQRGPAHRGRQPARARRRAALASRPTAA